MSGLHHLAQAAGLQIDWEDAAGRPQTVSDENLRRVLTALGYPAENEREIAKSLDKRREEEAAIRFMSAPRDEAFTIPLIWTNGSEAELRLEDGSTRPIQLERTADGWRVPAVSEIGYHTLATDSGEAKVAIAPERCLDVHDLTGGTRAWGAAVQIPSLWDSSGAPFGDYRALADAVARFAAAGADALAISPTHALFPVDATRFSPYAPSSRLFHAIHLASAAVGSGDAGGAEAELIDWPQAIPARLSQLRKAFAAKRDQHRAELEAFRRRKGTELERHATFDALHAQFFESGAHGWPDWPAEYHDPAGEAVARFAAEHAEEVEFFAWTQWLAGENLRAAQHAATSGGMAIGLIFDLAVGVDGGGSQAWSYRDAMLTGVSIGAPPDLLGPDGQNWGLTTFSPLALRRTSFAGFIATIRAALEHAGGVRIDHALGLNRMWVIPHGGTAADGAYLRYPLQDMLRILAIESHRARAVVIGEDLGTVPDRLRPQLEAAHVLGMRVLPFERDDGGYIPPACWEPQAVAMTGTHDLPTLAGWWQGRDIDWTWAIGRSSPHDSEEEARTARAEERTELWDALTASGATAGQQPDLDEPGAVVDAALTHVGGTPCQLAVIPLEDIVGVVEQPNLPGTIDEHPNWRRRMPDTTEALLERSAVARRIEALNRSRR